MSTNASTSTGLGFGGLLTIAFVVLKLTGVIAWSWWWVLAPAWIPFGLALIWVIIWLIVVIRATIRSRKRDRKL